MTKPIGRPHGARVSTPAMKAMTIADASAISNTPLMLTFMPDCSIQRPNADPCSVPPSMRSIPGNGPSVATLTSALVVSFSSLTGCVHFVQPILEPSLRHHRRQASRAEIDPHYDGDADQEREQRREYSLPHLRDAFEHVGRQMNTGGLQALARLRPYARRAEPADAPFRPASTPSFSNRKISCMVMTSPSMPVISEMLVTLRVPSLMRDC